MIKPIKPADPQWFVQFMSEIELNKENFLSVLEAMTNYQKNCLKAAKRLEKDLRKIPRVKVNK
jgi:hypothetical protein